MHQPPREIVMGLDVAVSAEALSDVQFSIAARLGRHHPVVVEPGPPCSQRPGVQRAMGPDPGVLRM